MLKLFDFSVECCGHFVGHLEPLGFFHDFADVIVLRIIAQFALYVLDLLLQEIFFLLLIEIFPRSVLYVALQRSILAFAIQDGEEFESPLFFIVDGEQFRLFLYGERKVRANETDEENRVADIADGKSGLVSHGVAHAYEAYRGVLAGVNQCRIFTIVCFRKDFWNFLDMGTHIWFHTCHFPQSET